MMLTEQQRRVLYALHDAHDGKRFVGVDADTLAAKLGLSPTGANVSAASLVRRGLADVFLGGVGRIRRHYVATTDVALCPHGCGMLEFHADATHCPKCGDEWEVPDDDNEWETHEDDY